MGAAIYSKNGPSQPRPCSRARPHTRVVFVLLGLRDPVGSVSHESPRELPLFYGSYASGMHSLFQSVPGSGAPVCVDRVSNFERSNVTTILREAIVGWCKNAAVLMRIDLVECGRIKAKFHARILGRVVVLLYVA